MPFKWERISSQCHLRVPETHLSDGRWSGSRAHCPGWFTGVTSQVLVCAQFTRFKGPRGEGGSCLQSRAMVFVPIVPRPRASCELKLSTLVVPPAPIMSVPDLQTCLLLTQWWSVCQIQRSQADRVACSPVGAGYRVCHGRVMPGPQRPPPPREHAGPQRSPGSRGHQSTLSPRAPAAGTPQRET